jgi:hypothetical protein
LSEKAVFCLRVFLSPACVYSVFGVFFSRGDLKMRFSLFLAVVIASFSAFSAEAKGPDGNFFVGYNQPWFEGNYGADLTTKFHPDFIRQTYQSIHSAGGSVTRIFLFTGLQGIRYPGGVPQGVSPDFLRNLETVLEIARESGLKVYVTPLVPDEANKVQGDWRQFFVNVLLNPAMTDLYNEKVLAPVLDVLDRNRDVVFGMDLANEIDSVLNKGFMSQDQARLWIWKSAAFVKGHSPWLRKTISVGWGGAQYLLIQGILSRLGLDFYDLHVYDDNGAYPGATDLCRRVKSEHMEIVLGEFGQKSSQVNDMTQYAATGHFLSTAYSMCFSGALAWDFSDPGQPWLAYRRSDGSFRPAVGLIQSFPRH